MRPLQLGLRTNAACDGQREPGDQCFQRRFHRRVSCHASRQGAAARRARAGAVAGADSGTAGQPAVKRSCEFARCRAHRFARSVGRSLCDRIDDRAVLGDRRGPAVRSFEVAAELLVQRVAVALVEEFGDDAQQHRVVGGFGDAQVEEPGRGALRAALAARDRGRGARPVPARAVCAPAGWRPPPLRAAFVFDDPNLRWRSYGYIDYARPRRPRRRARLPRGDGDDPARRVAPHRPTASLFARRARPPVARVPRQRPRQARALRPTDRDAALAMAAQARAPDRRLRAPLGRPGRPRDDAPARPLLAGDGARARRGRLRRAVRDPPAPVDRAAAARTRRSPAGTGRVRRRLRGRSRAIPLCSSPASTSRCGRCLDHPLVIYGHHEDVAGGLEPLAEAAALVNRLGDVRWTRVGEIALGNSSHRLDGDRLTVRPSRARAADRVARRARGHCAVEAPSPHRAASSACWAGRSAPAPVAPVRSECASPVPRRSRSGCAARATSTPRPVAAPAWRPWPRLRRAATEVRDRALPLRPRPRATINRPLRLDASGRSRLSSGPIGRQDATGTLTKGRFRPGSAARQGAARLSSNRSRKEYSPNARGPSRARGPRRARCRRWSLLAAVAGLVSSLLAPAAHRRSAERHATPRASRACSRPAQGGDTVLLASGDYGAFIGRLEGFRWSRSRRSRARRRPTMKISCSGREEHHRRGSRPRRAYHRQSTNVVSRGNKVTAPWRIDTQANIANAGIVLDGNTHDGHLGRVE